MPSAEGKFPAVLVIHENRGLNPHIKDVTRRMAAEGFVALGADYLQPMGGTPEDADKARDMIGEIKPEDQVAYSQKALAAVKAHGSTNGKGGAIGFCWGGGAVNALAVADSGLGAGVAYYGRQAPAADVPKISSPLMLHYAELDERINSGIADYEAALKAAGKAYELHMYKGANHAFNNDTNAARYNKEAADLAWSRTVAFLKQHLA
jgi:carboxymethylenebutenolidase